MLRDGPVFRFRDGELESLAALDGKKRSPKAFAAVLYGASFALRAREIVGRGFDEPIEPEELASGFVEWTRFAFGPMAAHVLSTWGIRGPECFEEVALILSSEGVFGKTVEKPSELCSRAGQLLARSVPNWLGPESYDCLEYVRPKDGEWFVFDQ